jgi:hypothetical protein
MVPSGSGRRPKPPPNDDTTDMMDSLLKELSVAQVRYTDAIKREGIYWTMVSSILWDQSARPAALTLPFPSTPRTAPESPRADFRKACQQTRVTDDDRNRLHQYEWAGNIRELQNVIGMPLFSQSRRRPAADRHQGIMDVRP